MPITTDTSDPRLNVPTIAGQMAAYLVLTDEERARGFVEPVRTAYHHVECGTVTTMNTAIAESYARKPSFYDGTYCAQCRCHPAVGEFRWVEDGRKTDLVVGQRTQAEPE